MQVLGQIKNRPTPLSLQVGTPPWSSPAPAPLHVHRQPATVLCRAEVWTRLNAFAQVTVEAGVARWSACCIEHRVLYPARCKPGRRGRQEDQKSRSPLATQGIKSQNSLDRIMRSSLKKKERKTKPTPIKTL